jgi:hypothetical protein
MNSCTAVITAEKSIELIAPVNELILQKRKKEKREKEISIDPVIMPKELAFQTK